MMHVSNFSFYFGVLRAPQSATGLAFN